MPVDAHHLDTIARMTILWQVLLQVNVELSNVRH